MEEGLFNPAEGTAWIGSPGLRVLGAAEWPALRHVRGCVPKQPPGGGADPGRATQIPAFPRNGLRFSPAFMDFLSFWEDNLGAKQRV